MHFHPQGGLWADTGSVNIMGLTQVDKMMTWQTCKGPTVPGMGQRTGSEKGSQVSMSLVEIKIQKGGKCFHNFLKHFNT